MTKTPPSPLADTFRGRAYLYPTPSAGLRPICVKRLKTSFVVAVEYAEGPRILHTPNLPSCSSPDLAQRSLDAFASSRNLQPHDRLPPHLAKKA